MERAVIVEGARTPIGKFLGSFAETPAVELGRIAAVEAMRRANVEPDQVDQTIMGHARQAGNGPNTGRQVSIRAGVPEEVSAFNVNIACGSGMKADAARRPADHARRGRRRAGGRQACN